MKTRNKLAICSVVVTFVAGLASADAGHRHENVDGERMARGHEMMEMMKMMTRMHGMSERSGEMSCMRMMDGAMPSTGLGKALEEELDADGDGTVTDEEILSGLNRLHSEHDSDEDGSLSLEEFEALHSALIRERMVDRFQHLDADGDGQVTEQEMNSHAEDSVRMCDRMRRRSEARRHEMMEGRGHDMHGKHDDN